MLLQVHSVSVQRSAPRSNTVRSGKIFQDRPPEKTSMSTCSNLGPLSYGNEEIGPPRQQATNDQNEKYN